MAALRWFSRACSGASGVGCLPWLLCWVGACAIAQTQTQSVVLSGILGPRALLVVDGTPPKSVAVGETHRGVKVLAVSRDSAEVEFGGQRQTLQLGASPLQLPSNRASGAQKIILTADSRGHFTSDGRINGQLMRFMIDTGATTVALAQAEADRLGIEYLNAPPVRVGTANGAAVGWRVRLHSIRIGEVDVYDVDAVVTPMTMPYVLLGNTYLSSFQMHRVNDQLTLEKKP